jgi:UDP-N-acetylmuramoyl-tripeptide--D-alanyl-D-alanine ligase
MKSVFKRIVVSIITLEARILLRRTKPQIIAVTGSVGKTSVKDAVFAVLKDHVHARKSAKTYNSETGVPLSILGLESGWSNPIKWLKIIIDGAVTALFPGAYPKLLVLEMGVDRPGDMANLTQWIKPDVVVLTRLPDVPVHVEFFASPEALIAEKRKLVDALSSDGVLIYNQDDQRVVEVAEETLQKSISYSRYSKSEFTASADKMVYEDGRPVGFEFTLVHDGREAKMYVQGSLGVQHAYNYAAAAAVGSIFNIDITVAAESLKTHLPPPGRMRILPGIKGTLIIDDTYNSSPAASERSLQTLKELRGVKRRIAVLGDMMELGQYSVAEHERIGALAGGFVDLLITVGVRAHGFANGALAGGMSPKNILQYDDILRAGRELESMVRPGDVIMIKGSQSIRAEKIVEEIMAQPEEAAALLVRQSAVWKQISY